MKKLYFLVLLAGLAVMTSACTSQTTINGNVNPNDVTPAADVSNNALNLSANVTTTPPPATAVVTPTPPALDEVIVNINNLAFSPDNLTIKSGTKVTWVNKDSVPHTIISDAGNLLESATLAPGGAFSFAFSSDGSVNYHCSIHPTMKGTIKIEKR